jgi:hypothetical protein
VIRIFLLCTLIHFIPTTAFADPTDGWVAPDDDELDLEEETEEEKKAREEAEKNRLDDDDSLDLLDDEEELDNLEEAPTEENTNDLLEAEIGKDSIGGEGEDNSTIFREAEAKFARMIPDEHMLAWERYLEEYPNSLYKDRIEKTMEELETILYEQLIDDREPDRLDADQRELEFASGFTIENLNPRSRAMFIFEWGLPDYMNLAGDYEHQIIRQLSIHAGFRRRFTGWNFETGARWALIKSSRTDMLLVFIGDFHFNLDPFFVGFRPQLGFGKKFGKLDVQIQAGVDLEMRGKASPRILTGINTTYHAAEQVSIFAETTLHMRNLTSKDFEPFRFNLISFGMIFYPQLKGAQHPKALEINIGASIPYTSAYWMFHYGSIGAQVNYLIK